MPKFSSSSMVSSFNQRHPLQGVTSPKAKPTLFYPLNAIKIEFIKRAVLILCSVFIGHLVFAQDSAIHSLSSLIKQSEEDSSKVLKMFELSNLLRKTDLNKAIAVDKEAKELSEKIGYRPGVAKALKSIGVDYYFSGKYAEALIYWQDAKSEFEKIGNTSGVANVLSNMGAIYHDQSEYLKAIDLYLQAIKLAEEERDTLRIGTVLQNIGAVHIDKGDDELALKAFEKALPLFVSIDYDEGIGLVYLNMGEIYHRNKDYIQAMDHFYLASKHLRSTFYYPSVLRFIGEVKLITSGFKEGFPLLDSAYKAAFESGDDLELVRTGNSIAKAYEDIGELQKALTYYEKGKSLLLAADKSNIDLRISTEGLVRIYSLKGDYQRAFENQKILQDVENSIYNSESDNKMSRLLFNFDLEKKEGEIALLVRDNEIQELEVAKQKGLRNWLIVGFLIVLIFAGSVLIQRNQIKKSKKLSDDLLLNILPEEIAEELKLHGTAEARNFDQVSILFTDFKEFTQISEKLSAKDLVAKINYCFKAFDFICEKYGVEKIKTIGDSYMAAGGLPAPNEGSVKNTVLAALEMAAFIVKHKAEQQAAGEIPFEMRTGIHTGNVVAGIVGVKKFQYDVWGDTVNTASRMESHGQIDQVNVSQSTYELLKNDSDFIFESRSKIQAKGKGEVEMFFVHRTLTP